MSGLRRFRLSRSALLPAITLCGACLLLLPATAHAATPTAAASVGESFVIKSDGTLWAWGGNGFGNLGTGDYLPRAIPAQVGAESTWTSIDDGGALGMFALKQGGTVWRWGGNTLPFDPTPTVQVAGSWVGPWDAVTAGNNHALLLKNGGELWAFGYNTYGMLGDGNSGPSAYAFTPIHIGSATWATVSAGDSHSLGIQPDGSLWAWGQNDHGELGLGDSTNRTTPTRVGAGTDWKAVFAGLHCSYALTTAGSLYAWGWNDYGQLGLGSGGDVSSPAEVPGAGWVDAAPGDGVCAALKADGTLWAWGQNTKGQLSLPPDDVNHDTPVQVGSGTGWVDAACGAQHILAVTGGDDFAAFGSNTYGQIGIGYAVERCDPEQMGTVAGWETVDAAMNGALGVRSDGTLWEWGANVSGGVAYFLTPTSPWQIGSDTDWKTVSCGASSTSVFKAAIKTAGTLWTWGDNSTGQLGLGDDAQRDAPTQVGTAADWATVSCSSGIGDAGRQLVGQSYTLDDHTLALKTDGTLWAWGANDYGQLGLGDTSDRLSPTQVGTDADWQTIDCGDDYSAAIKTDGSLWTWGRNQFGQLGLGGTGDASVPTQVAGSFRTVACGGGRDGTHTLAVKGDGTLWGWGKNYAGVFGRNAPSLFDQPIEISADSDWAEVACGSWWNDYSLALKTNGELWGTGGNLSGQLGSGTYTPAYELRQATGGAVWRSITAGANSFGIKQDGTLWAWGANDYGQLGLGDPSASANTTVYSVQNYNDSAAPIVSGSAKTASAAGGGGRRGGGWTRTPRTISVKATDAGSGVSRAQISVTGGIGYVTRGSVTVRNGDVKVYCRAIDRVGNRSAPQLIGNYKIDTTRPKPSAEKVTVKRGETAILHYRIKDYSPCAVRIVVKDARGHTAKTFAVKGARPGSTLSVSFPCTLAKGIYDWSVYATDSVGYTQVKPGAGKLYVK